MMAGHASTRRNVATAARVTRMRLAAVAERRLKAALTKFER
jgi:hypothetical protein